MTIPDPTAEYRFSGFRLDARHKRLFNDKGELVTLSSRPFDVLLTLVQHSGAVLSREELMEAVWPKLVVEEHNLTQAISIVRKALNDTTSESHFIRTVPGRGYCFIEDVEEHAAAATALDHAGVPTPAGVPSRMMQLMRAAGAAVLMLSLLAIVIMFRPVPPVQAIASASVQNAPSPLGVSEIPRPDIRIPNSIAVLPLANLSADGDDLFAVGLHDEVISQLTQIRSLNVISRSSVVTLLEQGLSTVDLTRVLRVESILSGTIRLAGTQARISLQLVDVRTGVTLWSGTYDVDQRNIAEMISIQRDIAVNVVAALRTEIPQNDRGDFSALPPELIEAYRYNLAARTAHDRQDYAQEWHLSMKAIELSPDFYEGLQTFASVNVVLVARPLPGMTSRQHAELALSHAIRMIELAPERSAGHALHAVTLAMNREWAAAASALDELRKTYAPLSDLEYAARVAMSLGDFDTAVAIYEANLTSELLNPYGRGFLMAALELAGRRDDARRKHATGQELHLAWWGDSVNVLLALGRNEALSDLDQLVGISDELRNLLTGLADQDQIYSSLNAYRDKTAKRPLEARFYAAIAAKLGEHDLAVEFLRASAQDAWSAIFWTWLPVFDETRQQESFRTMLRDSGLVSYWQAHGWPVMCQPLSNDFRCDWRAYPAETVPRMPIALGQVGD